MSDCNEHDCAGLLGSKGGKVGGAVRAALLNRSYRSAISSLAAITRWKKDAPITLRQQIEEHGCRITLIDHQIQRHREQIAILESKKAQLFDKLEAASAELPDNERFW